MSHNEVFLHVRDACLDPECSTPPLMVVPAQGLYTAYFENKEGEQLVVMYSPEIKKFTLRHGDWDLAEELEVVKVSEDELEKGMADMGLDFVSRAEARKTWPFYKVVTKDGATVQVSGLELAVIKVLHLLWDAK